MISQYYGPEGKGVQGILITTISFILIFSNIISGATLVYLTPRYSTKSMLLPSYIWSAITGLIAIPILALPGNIPAEMTYHIAFLTILNSLFTININILIGKEEINKANLIMLLQSVFTLIFLYLFIIASPSKSINQYVNALYSTYILVFIISLAFLNRSSRTEVKISGKGFMNFVRDSFRYGITNQITHVIQLLNFRLSYYLLDYYYSKGDVGIYSNGVSVSEAVWLISGSICLVQFSKISNTTNHKESQQLTTRLARIGVFISLVLVSVLALIPSDLYEIVFGKGFGSMRIIILTMLPGILIYNYSVIYAHYFSGTGKYYINAISSVIGLAFTLSLAPFCIKSYGSIGAASVSTISQIATAIFLMYIYKKEAGLKTKDFMPDYKASIDFIPLVINKFRNK